MTTYDIGTVQRLDEALKRAFPPWLGRQWHTYTASDGSEWNISEPASYMRGIWAWCHTDTETEPDGEGGIQPTDNRHGTGDGLLDCIVQIETFIGESAQ